MNTSTQDRLKAFLGRNRARVSSLANEKEGSVPLEGTSANDDNARASSRLADNISAPLSSRFPTQSQTMSSSNVFARTSDNQRVNYTEGNEYTEEDSPQRKTVSDMRSSKIMQKSRLSMESPISRTQRGPLRSEMTPVRSDAKRNNSTSPIREARTSSTSSKNMNMIESYVSGRKKIGDKMRDHLKSLSKDNKKTTVSAKSNSLSLNYQSSLSKHQLGITSDALETQESLSYRKPKTPVREKKDSTKADKIYDKSKKHNTSQRQPSSVFSSGVKRTKEEKHEYAFEEAPKVNKVKKGNKTTRDISRSMSRSISPSPTPKTVVKVKKEKKAEKSQQVTQRQTADKSPKNKSVSVSQNGELFPESSRRLQDLDSSTNNESKFKKEIQKLIEIIKNEKEDITKNLESMSSELLKYKAAYKKLKKKYQHQKEKKEASIEKKNSRNNENILAGAEEGEAQNSFQYSSSNGINKALSIKKHEENYVPFTIEELNKHLDNNLPVTTNENPIELLSKMNDINLDVQNIIAKTQDDLSNRDSAYNSNFETHSFQLRRNPINCYIIKEMNLASHLFFQDALKEVEQDADFTPTVIDLLAAQREIIHFLIRKIEIEEKQRLKTEEQANQMVIQMEKTIKQLEERGPGSRKRESTSTTELNKSAVSQNA